MRARRAHALLLSWLLSGPLPLGSAVLALDGSDRRCQPRLGVLPVHRPGVLRRDQLADLERDLAALASPELESRDSPSPGLERAARWIEERMRVAGLSGADEGASFRLPFELERDFVPLQRCSGVAARPALFLGFGAMDVRERYDDIGGADTAGTVAVFLEGEPSRDDLFEGAAGVRRLLLRKGEHLWERSDHFPFHEAARPRGHEAVLVLHTAWALAEDEEAPRRPR